MCVAVAHHFGARCDHLHRERGLMRTQHFESRLILMRTSNPSSRIDLRLPIWVAVVVAVSALAYGATSTVAATPSSPAPTAPGITAPGIVTSLSRRPSHNGRYAAEVVAHSPVVVGTMQS